MPTFSEAEVRSYLGKTPEDVARELQSFTKSAQILSSDHPRLIDEYRKQWVAIFAEKVEAHGSDLRDVLNQLELKKIQPSIAIIRFINDEEPPMTV